MCQCPYYNMQNYPAGYCPSMYETQFADYLNNTYETFRKSTEKKSFSRDEAQWIANKLNIKFDKFDLDQFWVGVNVELEHGTVNPFTNVTNDDPILTGKIALAHLNEIPDYYDRLTKMEAQAKQYWNSLNK